MDKMTGKKKPKLGSGGRFKAGVKEMESKGMSKESASAVMAKAGMEKYGKTKMMGMAKKGRKRAARNK